MTEIFNPPQFDHAAIAKQNDAFRRHVCLGSPWPGDVPPLDGQLVCTAAIATRGALFTDTCRRSTGFHSDFPESADPNGLHEFGAFEVRGVNVWWKIDGVGALSHCGISCEENASAAFEGGPSNRTSAVRARPDLVQAGGLQLLDTITPGPHLLVALT